MATERTVRTTGRNTTMAMALTAVFLAAFVGALLLILRAPAPARPLGPATHPAAPTAVIAPAQQGAMGSTATHRSATPAFSQRARQFVDEVAGAGAQGVEPASLTGPLPERLQDLDRPTAWLISRQLSSVLPPTGAPMATCGFRTPALRLPPRWSGL